MSDYVYTGPGGIDPQTAHEAEIGRLKEQLYQLEVRLARLWSSCNWMGYRQKSCKQGDYGWSPAFEAIMKLREHSWRCFHCGFFTFNEKEAAAHFGDRDDPDECKPLCKWWQGMDDGERAAQFQDLIMQLNEAREEAQDVQ